MRVEVWTRGVGIHKAKCVWRGEMPAVPQPGDYVVVLDGYCSEPVREVHWDLPTMTAEVKLETADEGGEYPGIDGEGAG